MTGPNLFLFFGALSVLMFSLFDYFLLRCYSKLWFLYPPVWIISAIIMGVASGKLFV